MYQGTEFVSEFPGSKGKMRNTLGLEPIFHGEKKHKGSVLSLWGF